jgi:site-specific recombinase XerD
MGESKPAESVAGLPLQRIVQEYLSFYAAGESHTARAKRLDAAKFLGFLTRYTNRRDESELIVSHWDYSATQRFIDESLRAGEAPATVARRLATIKHMGRMLAERLPGFINPAREVKAPKIQTLRPKSIPPEEVARVREKASERRVVKGSFNRLRNETLLNLLLDTGLRADEVRTLRMGQLDEKLQWIDKVKTKGRRFRTVYITSEMRPALSDYLEARARELARFYPSLNKAKDAKLPLFISGYRASPSDPASFQMSPKSVWRAIRECSVDMHLHPHLLRHTYASELLDHSRDIRLVAQALGHSDVRVTMRYTERTNEEVAAALEKVRKSKEK